MESPSYEAFLTVDAIKKPKREMHETKSKVYNS